MNPQPFLNPFRPGAGQSPPHLAGRGKEQEEFKKLLEQTPILKNLILTGLRGVGKTVLLETFKPIAYENGWFWAGTDLSETASVSEQNMVIRILADLAAITSSFSISVEQQKTIGFSKQPETIDIKLSYNVLMSIYNTTPGLEADKLKRVLDVVWESVKGKVKGIVLAYDEAQNLKDHATEREYPLSLLLEVVQYLQRRQIPYLLVLTGLPTLYPTLVEARTYSERMFHIINLDKLTPEESREAIETPIKKENCPATFTQDAINEIVRLSGGYPYFIQFFCKETFDAYIQQISVGIENPMISITDIIAKLDTDFYSGRMSRITDKQRELLRIAAKLPTANEEFTGQDILNKAKELNDNKFSASYINQYLVKLIYVGLIFKNKFGKYCFAVPLLADYINRQEEEDKNIPF